MIFLVDWAQQKLNKKYIFWTFLAILVGFSVPRPLVQVFRFTKEIKEQKTSFLLSNDQLALFQPLFKNKDEFLIQTDLDNEVAKKISFLPFFANRASYLTGQETLDFQGMKWQSRYDGLKFIEEIDNAETRSNEYKSLNIHYFYLKKIEAVEFWKNNGQDCSEVIAENSAGILLKLK
jgi:hypothetical protein